MLRNSAYLIYLYRHGELQVFRVQTRSHLPNYKPAARARHRALVRQRGSMADTTGETQAWAPNPDVDGDWLEAVVVSRGDDGNVVLKTVANGAEHTCPADKLNLMNVLPEQVSA